MCLVLNVVKDMQGKVIKVTGRIEALVFLGLAHHSDFGVHNALFFFVKGCFNTCFDISLVVVAAAESLPVGVFKFLLVVAEPISDFF